MENFDSTGIIYNVFTSPFLSVIVGFICGIAFFLLMILLSSFLKSQKKKDFIKRNKILFISFLFIFIMCFMWFTKSLTFQDTGNVEKSISKNIQSLGFNVLVFDANFLLEKGSVIVDLRDEENSFRTATVSITEPFNPNFFDVILGKNNISYIVKLSKY